MSDAWAATRSPTWYTAVARTEVCVMFVSPFWPVVVPIDSFNSERSSRNGVFLWWPPILFLGLVNRGSGADAAAGLFATGSVVAAAAR